MCFYYPRDGHSHAQLISESALSCELDFNGIINFNRPAGLKGLIFWLIFHSFQQSCDGFLRAWLTLWKFLTFWNLLLSDACTSSLISIMLGICASENVTLQTIACPDPNLNKKIKCGPRICYPVRIVADSRKGRLRITLAVGLGALDSALCLTQNITIKELTWSSRRYSL